MSGTSRARMTFAGCALATIGAGLLLFLVPPPLPERARDVLGDALWAAMITAWVGALAPERPLIQRAAAAYLFCAAVELGQLVHNPTLDALRATPVGHLVLGTDFDPRDLVAYALGVAAAVLAERAVRRRRDSVRRHLFSGKYP